MSSATTRIFLAVLLLEVAEDTELCQGKRGGSGKKAGRAHSEGDNGDAQGKGKGRAGERKGWANDSEGERKGSGKDSKGKGTLCDGSDGERESPGDAGNAQDKQSAETAGTDGCKSAEDSSVAMLQRCHFRRRWITDGRQRR